MWEKGKEKKKREKKMMKKWKGDQKRYNEPQWVENQKTIHAKLEGSH